MQQVQNERDNPQFHISHTGDTGGLLERFKSFSLASKIVIGFLGFVLINFFLGIFLRILTGKW